MNRRYASSALVVVYGLLTVVGVMAQTDSQDLFAQVFGEVAEQRTMIPIYRNGEFLGEAQSIIQGDQARIDPAEFKLLVESLVSDAARAAIGEIADSGQFVEPGVFARAGVFLTYRANRIQYDLSIAPESLRLQEVGADRSVALPNLREPIPFSGYVNLLGRSELSTKQTADTYSVSADPVVNYRGWVLEGSATFSSAPVTSNTVAEDPVTLRYARLVREIPRYQWRTEVGHVRYQSGELFNTPEITGISVTRGDDIGRGSSLYRREDVEFVVPRRAPVTVYLNDRTYRRETLNTGSFRFLDIPVGRGVNRIRVEQDGIDGDDAAVLYEETTPYSPFLLRPGRSVYSWVAGVLRDSFEQEPDSADSFFVSGTHRTGILPRWTIGADLQAGIEEYAVGVYSLIATGIGITRINGATSFDQEGNSGTAAELSHVIALLHARRWPLLEFSGSVEDPGYRQVLSTPREGGRLRLGMTLNQRLSAGFNTTLGVVHTRPIEGEQIPQTTVRATFVHQSDRGFSLNANLSQTYSDGQIDWGAGIFIRFSSDDRLINTATSYDLVDDTASLQVSNAPRDPYNEVKWSADYRRSADLTGETHTVGGFARYDTYYGSLEARPGVTFPRNENPETQVTAQFATGLAWAGSTLAVTRPIRDSFAMFIPHPAVEGYRIPLRLGGGAPAAELRRSAAVIPDLAAWNATTVRIDGAYLPDGLSVGVRDVSFVPRYRSGYLVLVGSDASVVVEGRIVAATSGEPVALEAGEVIPESAEEPSQLFFTNREGNFEIPDVRPGSYRIVLLGHPEVELGFEIPSGVSGRYVLEDVILLEEEEP